jgi:hypothetical protein
MGFENLCLLPGVGGSCNSRKRRIKSRASMNRNQYDGPNYQNACRSNQHSRRSCLTPSGRCAGWLTSSFMDTTSVWFVPPTTCCLRRGSRAAMETCTVR